LALATLKSASGLKKVVLKNNPFSITEDTWLAFAKSLEECIEKQDVTADLQKVVCPIDIFYGTLDQFLIKNNIRTVAMNANISLHPIRNGHLITDKYAQAVAQSILM
jgi:hypothetical protein